MQVARQALPLLYDNNDAIRYEYVAHPMTGRQVARQALPLVDLRRFEDANNMAHLLARNKGRLFMHNKEAALTKVNLSYINKI